MDFSAETLAKIRLSRMPGVGPITFRKLILKCGSAEQAVDFWAAQMRREEKDVEKKYGGPEKERDALAKLGGRFLVWGEEDYPPLLHVLPDPPVVLSVLGDVHALTAALVGVVGNRNASAHGMQWTRALARDLAAAGVGVVSGLSRGIDTAAHEGALDGNGVTVAAVAGGVDHIYPPQNKKLREEMLARGGAIISEQPLGMVPVAGFFPRRNRMIAGLSVGVVVSEATRHSGSLITAEHALAYGRDVWAVPGSPSDPRASGPNWLLKQGAALVEGAGDILAAMPSVEKVKRADALRKVEQNDLPLLREEAFVSSDDAGEAPALPAADTVLTPALQVLRALGKAPVALDDLVRACAMEEREVMGILTELELDGSALRGWDGMWTRG